jgi:polygalacturonase
MSIGSETNGGVSAIEIIDLTIEDADNGLRIKSNPSRGGLVEGITYRDVCMRNVKNPIVLDKTYDRVVTGPLVPVFRGITFDAVHVDSSPRCEGRFVPFPQSAQEQR